MGENKKNIHCSSCPCTGLSALKTNGQLISDGFHDVTLGQIYVCGSNKYCVPRNFWETADLRQLVVVKNVNK